MDSINVGGSAGAWRALEVLVKARQAHEHYHDVICLQDAGMMNNEANGIAKVLSKYGYR